MRSLIVNLTRFGDLIQSQPVFTGLAQKGPCSLVCLENFAPAAGLLADVDQVHALPAAGLLADLDQAEGRGWREALARLSRFREQVLASGSPDLVVNLTPSLSSRILASSLARVSGAELRGFAVDAFGFNADTSPWAVFLQMASANRGASPFNVVDLFRRAAGLGIPHQDSLESPPEPRPNQLAPKRLAPDQLPPDQDASGPIFRLARPDPAALARAAELLGPGQGFAGFQLGASEERRRWPVERFAEVARGLQASHGLTPVLLGGGAEARLGAEMAALLSGGGGPPHIDLMGRTSLPELGAVVSRLSLLVTNDTGTMHLAAGLGVPCAAVFLATAQPFDTGPYLEGSVCFEPDLDCHPCPFGATCPREHACREAVLAPVVLELARALLDGQEIGGGRQGRGARIWRVQRAGDGFMDLHSLSGHENEPRTRWIRIQRHYYRRFLDELPPESLSGPHGLPSDQARTLSIALGGVAGALQLLTEQARLLAQAPREALKRKFLASWQRVGALLAAEPRLEVLGFLWNHQTQSAGGDLSSMLRTTARYHDLVLALAEALSGS